MKKLFLLLISIGIVQIGNAQALPDPPSNNTDIPFPLTKIRYPTNQIGAPPPGGFQYEQTDYVIGIKKKGIFRYPWRKKKNNFFRTNVDLASKGLFFNNNGPPTYFFKERVDLVINKTVTVNGDFANTDFYIDFYFDNSPGQNLIQSDGNHNTRTYSRYVTLPEETLKVELWEDMGLSRDDHKHGEWHLNFIKDEVSPKFDFLGSSVDDTVYLDGQVIPLIKAGKDLKLYVNFYDFDDPREPDFKNGSGVNYSQTRFCYLNDKGSKIPGPFETATPEVNDSGKSISTISLEPYSGKILIYGYDNVGNASNPIVVDVAVDDQAPISTDLKILDTLPNPGSEGSTTNLPVYKSNSENVVFSGSVQDSGGAGLDSTKVFMWVENPPPGHVHGANCIYQKYPINDFTSQGPDFLTYNYPFKLEGYYRFFITAQDSVGNITVISKTPDIFRAVFPLDLNEINALPSITISNSNAVPYEIYVDHTEPKLTLSSTAVLIDGLYSGIDGVTVVADIEETLISDSLIQKLEFQVNGLPVNWNTQNIQTIEGKYGKGTISILTKDYLEGKKILTVKATDEVGNSKIANFDILLDRTPPSINLIQMPSETIWHQKPQTIMVESTDNILFPESEKDRVVSGLLPLKYKNYNFPNGPFITAPNEDGYLETNGTIEINTEGINTISFRSWDKLGNCNKTVLKTVKFDETVPVITIKEKPNTAVNNPMALNIVSIAEDLRMSRLASVTLFVQRPKPLSNQSVSLAPLEQQNTQDYSFNYPMTEEGLYTFNWSATDKAGNQALAATFSTYYDRTPPNITIVDGLPNGPTSKTVSISFRASDSGSQLVSLNPLTYSLDKGITWINGNSFVIKNEGVNYFRLRALDNAGNLKETADYKVVIDYTQPKLLKVQTTPNPSNTPIVFTFTTSDQPEYSENFVQVQVKKGPSSNWENVSSGLIAKDSGAHNWEFRAIDAAGNISAQTIPVSFVYDDTGPTIYGMPPGNSGMVNKSILVSSLFNGSDSFSPVTRWNYAVNGQQAAGNFVLSQEGAYEVTAIAYDALDNASNRAGVKFWIDKTIPGNTWSNNSKIWETWTKTGNETVYLKLPQPEIWDTQRVQDVLELDYDTQVMTVIAAATETGITLTCYTNSQGPSRTFIVDATLKDRAGNKSNPISWNIKFDNQNPEVTAVQVTSNGKIFPENMFLGSQAFDAMVVGTDNSSAPLMYQAIVSETAFEPSENLWSNQWYGEKAPFIVRGVTASSVSVFFRLRDQAGNISPIYRRAVAFDTDLPNPPEIIGKTHSRASNPSDAVSLNTAEFFFIQPSTGPSGSEGVEWALFQGNEKPKANQVPLFKGRTTDNRLVMGNLKDNGEHEYFWLSAKALGGNGRESNQSIYPFRVDQTPPEVFTIHSLTHPNPTIPLNSERVLFNWQIPKDMSGIKAYYYKIFQGRESAPLSFKKDETWKNINASYIEFNAGIQGWEDSEILMVVCAEDWAGNLRFASREILIDRKSPVWSSVGWQVIPDINKDSAILTWDKLFDNWSDLPPIVSFQLWSIEDGKLISVTSPISRNVFPGSYVFPDLKQDQSYLIQVTAEDYAGNKTTNEKIFNLKGTDIVDLSFEQSFNKLVEGYHVSGIETKNGTTTESIKAKVNFDQGSPWRLDRTNDLPQAELLSPKWNQTGIISGSNSQVVFKGNFHGYDSSAKGFSLETGNGFRLEEFRMDFPGIVNTPLFLGQVQFKGAPDYSWSGGTLNTPQLEFKTAITKQDIREDVWSFTKGEGIALIGKSLIVKKAFWENRSGLNAYSTTTGKNAMGFWVTDIEFDSPGHLVRGLTQGSLIIETDTVALEVLESILRDDRLEVIKARVILPEGAASKDLYLSDVYFTKSGTIIAGPNFAFTPDVLFKTKDYQVKPLSVVVKDNKLVLPESTLIRQDKKTFVALNLIVTKKGVDIEQGEIAGQFEKNLFGFTVRGFGGKIVAGSWEFEAAEIDLTAFKAMKVPLKGLSIKLEDESILTPGMFLGRQTLVSGYDADSLTITKLTIGPEGVIGQIETLLPEPWLIKKPVIIPEVRLDSKGVLNTKTYLDKLSLSINGFAMNLQNIGLTEKGLSVAEISTLLPKSFSKENYNFKGLLILKSGEVIKTAVGTEPVNFLADDWTFEFKPLELTTTGLGGLPELALPDALGGNKLTLGKMSIFYNNTYQLMESSQDFWLPILGWSGRITKLQLAKENILFQNVELSLPQITGGTTVVFDELMFNSSGELLKSGTSGPCSFRGRNGFFVDSNGLKFSGGGLIGSGKISFLGIEKTGIEFGENGILITPEGYVLAGGINAAPATIYLKGFEVQLIDYVFGKNELSVTKAIIPINKQISIALPAFSILGSGEFINPCVSHNGFRFDLIQDQLTLSVESFLFDEEGFHLKAFVSLPKFGSTLYLDDIVLHPDGTVSSNKTFQGLKISSNSLGIDMGLERTRLEKNGLKISKVEFSFNTGSFKDKQIILRDVFIGYDGSLTINNFNDANLKVFGYTIFFENLALTDQSISFGGIVKLPHNLPIPFLNGAELDIEKLTVGFDGEIKDFIVPLNVQFDFPLNDSWTLHVDKVKLDKDWLRIEKATMDLPPQFGESVQAEASDFAVNFRTGEMMFGEVSIGNLQFQWDGFIFNIQKLALSKNQGMFLQGTALVPAKSTSGVEFPTVLHNRQITVSELQILPDNTVGKIDASLSGLSGPLIGESIYLEDGTVQFSNSGGSLNFSLGGNLKLGSDFPTGLAGTTMAIQTLEYSGHEGSIIALNASYVAELGNPLKVDLFGLLKTELLRIGLSKNNQGVFSVDLAGDIYLGQMFPEYLKNKKIAINQLCFNSTGTLETFDAQYDLPEGTEIISGLLTKSTIIRAGLTSDKKGVVFNVGGALALGTNFPKAMAGTIVNIDRFVFDTLGNIKDISVNAELPPDMNIYGGLKIKNGSLGIKKIPLSNKVAISIEGSVTLPEALPEGLAKLEIPIKSLQFTSSGDLLEMDLGISNINLSLYQFAVLEKAGLRVTKIQSEELLKFEVSGGLKLPNTLPEGLRGVAMVINRFEFTSDGNVQYFDVGLDGARLSFDLFAGMKIEVKKLDLSKAGFDVGGMIVLPNEFIEGLPRRIDLTSLSMDWSGNIKKIEAGFDQATIYVAGFGVAVKELQFLKDRVAFAEASMTLPDNLGGQSVRLINAGYNFKGDFFGGIGVDHINTNVAGFDINLKKPSFDFTNRCLKLEEVDAAFPEFLGGVKFQLYGVKIKPSGLSFGGGSFTLPPFAIPGGMGFRDCKVTFIVDGKYFKVEGGGKATVPALGEFEAIIGFTNISKMYPIGLSRAFFSYEALVGLPVGNTGVFINGVRGGLAFGPAKEVPYKVQPYFKDKGMRLQLGISLYAINPSVLSGKGDMWIDLWNWSFASRSYVEILSGLLSSEMLAAFSTELGFMGYVNIRLLYLEGEATVWIFPYKGDCIVNGAASVAVIVPEEFFFGVWPDEKKVIAKIGADMGTFTNGKKGFKGYLKIPYFGTYSAFVNSHTLDLGADSYHLLMPY